MSGPTSPPTPVAIRLVHYMFEHWGGRIQTRLRDDCVPELEYIPCPYLVDVYQAGIREPDLIATLREMHALNLITMSERVHEFDGSEYVITWESTTKM